jgi:hypothetical protein
LFLKASFTLTYFLIPFNLFLSEKTLNLLLLLNRHPPDILWLAVSILVFDFSLCTVSVPEKILGLKYKANLEPTLLYLGLQYLTNL